LRDDPVFSPTEDGFTMSDQVFCYHCRRQHPADQVTLIQTRGVKRWRCRQSLSLSRASPAARDAFGQAVSELNRMVSARQADRPLPRPVLELFGSAAA